MIYTIAFDLTAPERNEARIDEWIAQSFEDRAQLLPRLWVVSGPLAGEQIRTALAPLLGARDRIVIIKTATEALSHGLDPEAKRWLAESFPGSITERVPG